MIKMTGEMIKPDNAEKKESYWKGATIMGCPVLGDPGVLIYPNYPEYFDTVEGLREMGHEAEVEPFDVYQGPYILVNNKYKIWFEEDGLTLTT